MFEGGDPTVGRPWLARPWAVLAWGGALYGLVTLPPALTLIGRAIDEGMEPIVAWATLCVCFALPVGAALGLLAAGRERVVLGRALNCRFTWVGHGLATALLAHWAVLLAWTPVALVLAVTAGSWSRDRYLASALAGLVPWGAVGVSLALFAGTRWAFRGRRFREGAPLVPLPLVPHLIGAGLVSALLVAPAMLVATAIAAERGDGAALAPRVIAVLAGIGLLAGVAFASSGAAAEVEGARSGAGRARWDVTFASYLGVFIAVQWAAVLPLTLLPAWESAVGQRFALQSFAWLAVVLGVALAGRRLAGLEEAPGPG